MKVEQSGGEEPAGRQTEASSSWGNVFQMEMQLTFCCPSFCPLSEPPPTAPVFSVSLLLLLSSYGYVSFCHPAVCSVGACSWSLDLTH